MKCVDCGTEFEFKKKEADLKVTLDNPGIVIFKGQAAQCPNCGEKYSDEDDYKELAEAFDKAHKEKHGTK